MDKKDLLRIGLIILTGAVLIYLVNCYRNRQSINESFVNEEYDHVPQEETAEDDADEYNVQAGENMGDNEIYSSVDTQQDNSGNQYPNDCFPKDQLTAAELLPSDANSKWAQVNPAGQGELGDQNFLNAGYHVGVNTVGQTLRNANLQIRSEPPNPQAKVSPWLQSTIEPDTNRKPMEIGGCE